MAGNTLALPLDITWQRLGYSRDLIDADFQDLLRPPKWRSSMTIYSYVVPETETAETYPDARIVYLKLSCSITGWNPDEDLRQAEEILNQAAGDQPGDAQVSIWEAIRAQGWATRYWPCYGALAQLGVFPSPRDREVGPDDYPYIVDFEPKKRELYEARTESGEYLSGTAHAVSTLKGTTTIRHTEKSVKATASYGPRLGGVGFGGSISAGYQQSDETTKVDNTTTDNSRERRETQSHSTTFSQLYQLFNGYHLGSNRAVFLVAPRPHIANTSEGGSDETQTDFNLIAGQRKLEGIQEIFLVVHVPKSLEGICIHTSLDTGHNVREELVATAMGPRPIGSGGDGGAGGGGGGGGGEPDPVINDYLVVTRRHIKCCGLFGEDATRLDATQVPVPIDLPSVIHEDAIGEAGMVVARSSVRARDGGQPGLFRKTFADQLNQRQRQISNSMLDGFSSGGYSPRSFIKTRAFRMLATHALRTADIPLQKLLPEEETRPLQQANLASVADLFSARAERKELRRDLVDGTRARVASLLHRAVETAGAATATATATAPYSSEASGQDAG